MFGDKLEAVNNSKDCIMGLSPSDLARYKRKPNGIEPTRRE